MNDILDINDILDMNDTLIHGFIHGTTMNRQGCRAYGVEPDMNDIFVTYGSTHRTNKDEMCRDANLDPQVRCHRLDGGWGRQSGDVPFPAEASFPVSRLCFAGLTPGTASAAPLHRPQPACMQDVYGEMMQSQWQ